MTNKTIAYHFTGDRLRDGRPIPQIGETLRHSGPIEWCRSGLYASRQPFDALKYAPGNMLHMVECGMIEQEGEDKLACRERTILASVDATYLMRRFAADQALSVAHLWNMPPLVRDYLTSLDKGKREAAWAAAKTVARVAWAAEGAAARAAAWAAEGTACAARDAAWGAAREATEVVVWANAEDASRAARNAARAAWAAARQEFNKRVEEAFASA